MFDSVASELVSSSSSASTIVLTDRAPPRGKLQSYADARRKAPRSVKRGSAPAPRSKGSSKKRAAPKSSRWTAKKAKNSSNVSDSGPKSSSKAAPVSQEDKFKASVPKTTRADAPVAKSSAKGKDPAASKRSTGLNSSKSSQKTPSTPSQSQPLPAPGTVELPAPLQLPITTLRARAAQAVAREVRETPSMRQTLNVEFYHYGSARCWAKMLACRSPVTMLDIVAKSSVAPTPTTLDGLQKWMDVFNPSHPCQQVLAKFPETPIFVSASEIDAARQRLHSKKKSAKSTTPLMIVCDAWARFLGDSREFDESQPHDSRTKIFVALWERNHWIVDSSVLLGLHPDLNPSSPVLEFAAIHELWTVYTLERKRRGDLLRIVMKSYEEALRVAASSRSDQGPSPSLDSELYFEPTVPTYSLINQPMFPSRSDWFAELKDLDVQQRWQVWWVTRPELHPYNTCFRPRNPEFPVFAPGDFFVGDVERTLQEDTDPNEPEPLACDKSAQPPANRTGLRIFEQIFDEA